MRIMMMRINDDNDDNPVLDWRLGLVGCVFIPIVLMATVFQVMMMMTNMMMVDDDGDD